MPGDELLADADIVTTRAITIDTGADAIWPWLVQLGPGRGGAYTYDWIENLLGLDMHSADQILPQFQNLKVGDGFALGKSGPRMRAAAVERERTLVFASDDGHWVWAFGLYPAGQYTRLVSRNRIGLTGASNVTRRFYRYVMEPASLVMERKMLYGIKRRAEQPAFPPPRCGHRLRRHECTRKLNAGAELRPFRYPLSRP
ncbi:SRPBCC family protein [Nocardia beijingensis]|uniref:SRPBCC family protein n=1 Tax=Nocardia beijingensis TaxID=95162 RepID=UPI00189481B7|nr:SRPBCC family protein [Nocardia beijingensis]MBF6469395.1 SRPBCC family protein [Nocardia beijingensis]